MTIRGLVLVISLLLSCVTATAQTSERELHWDSLEVDAHLDAGGVLDVIERHSMVFTGDWNGGERVFNVRPRQELQFLSLERVDANTGAVQRLQDTSVPDDVDEFTWTDSRTLRWRSRLSSEPPFSNTRLTYVLRYRLSGILLQDDAQYTIDHDFAFPNRSGPIARLSLNLSLDPAWQPLSEIQNRYTAGPLQPGQGFVLKIPLRYTGSGAPAAIDTSRPPGIVAAVLTILGGFAFFVLAFLRRERSQGRFAPVDASGIDGGWIETNILAYPAEVVGAAWDGRVGAPEVVALIARLTAEGKLESKVEDKDSITLGLRVDRSEFRGHERALVDGLFFDQRKETSTKDVQQHYRSRGFDPATVVKPGLEEQVRKVLPPGNTHVGRLPALVFFLAGVVLLLWTAFAEPVLAAAALVAGILSLLIAAILQIPGWLYRSRMDWGPTAAALLMVPALFVSLGIAGFLWFVAGTGQVELPWMMIAALTALALGISNSSINGMKSRQGREAIAFRKRLTTGRSFFLKELEQQQPNLRDGWYPWLLAFGLAKQVDAWSSRHTTTTGSSSSWDHTASSSAPGPSSSHQSTPPGWTGGGGRSGGAGASGTWAAAAAGMAAGVATPSSSSSSGGGSSSSSGGGSSGGGGGGGW